MKSPFQVFRRHQKVMMVVLVGLAMLCFVIGGTINDPSSVSGPMMVALLALAVGSITFLIGLSNKKSKEYGSYGLVIGACIGLILVWRFSPAPAISMTGSDISTNEFQVLRQRRRLANSFVQTTFQLTGMGVPEAPFGSLAPQDIAFAEVLRREADRLGIVGSQEVVTAFLQDLMTPPGTANSRLTREIMRQACREIGASEQAVYEAIEDEWRIQQAAMILSGGGGMTPELYWDAHQRLKVQQDIEFAALPLEEFVDDSMEPSEAELEEFFSQYRENQPNLTPDGEPDEGRPGFLQPGRAQMAYVEGSPEDFFDQVTVTPEEIEAEYSERFSLDLSDPHSPFSDPGSSVPAGDPLPDPFLNGPIIPPSLTPDSSDGDDAPETDLPEESAPAENANAADESLPESTEAPVTEEESAPSPETESETTDSEPQPEAEESQPPVDEATPETDDNASSCDDPVAEEVSAPETPESSDEASTIQSEASQDAPADETANSDQPADESPTDEAPADTDAADDLAAPADAVEETEPAAGAEAAADAEAVTSDAAAVPPFTLSESEVPPPPPLAEAAVAPFPPPLTDELKAEIEEYLRRKKADELLAANLESFMNEFEQSDIPARATIPAESDEHLSTTEALEAIRRLASEETGDDDAATFDYFLETTPLLSMQEFSDEVPPDLAAAVIVDAGELTGTPVLHALYATQGDRYIPVMCATPSPTLNPQVPGIPLRRFVIWKIAETAPYAPESIDDGREGLDPPLRDRVVESWLQFQARQAVETRAEQLLEIAKGSEEPFSVIFQDVPLIEGQDITINVSQTNPTSKLTWYTTSSAASPFAFPPPVPELASLPNFPDVETGDRFFETVFREMNVGDVQAVWNGDYSYMFIVRVNDRIPASQDAFLDEVQAAYAEFDQNRQFIAQIPQMMPGLLQVASRSSAQQSGRYDIFQALMTKYDVVINEEAIQ